MAKARNTQKKTPNEIVTINIPELKIRTLTVRIRGTSLLVLHAWSEKSKRMMQEAQSGQPKQGKKNREPRNPNAEFQSATYYTDDGRPGIPARSFKGAMVQAAVDCGIHRTVVKRTIFMDGEILPIEGGDPVMREDFVRLESGVADIRYRPMWEKWSVVLTIRYNASIISAAHIINLLRTAGFGCGVGENRASSPKGVGAGWGSFDVESAED